MEKKKSMPKVIMAAGVAAMGLGLFSTLQNEARATGSATVQCKDVENFGTGLLRDRICADGTTPHCDWEDYNIVGTNGTCTLD